MGKIRIDPFKRPEGPEDYWETPNGKENLPRKGARCLFELKGCAIASRTQTLFYPVAFDWEDYRKGQNVADMSIAEVF